MHDLRFAFRLFTKTPGFTAAAITVLALGIGLNTAMFSFVHALVFSPRAFPDSHRVLQLYTYDRKEPTDFRAFSYPAFREIQTRGDVFSGVFAHLPTMVGLDKDAVTRRTFSSLISANFFEVLGVSLARGRPFTAEEERPGSNLAVAIASHTYWKEQGFAQDLVGRTVRVNDRPFTLVGIAPEGFSGTMALFGPTLYFPLGVHGMLMNDFIGESKRTLERADSYNLFLAGRLRDGVSPEAASAALDVLGRVVEQSLPVEYKDKTFSAGLLPRLGTSTSPRQESVLTVLGLTLLGLSGAVLLVVCLNLAGLILARGHARRREFAIRLALGGGRARLVRQLLTEGFLLALAGGALGILLAIWASDLLVASLSARLPITIVLNSTAAPMILAATVGFCLLATLFFSLGPALQLSGGDVITDLKLSGGDDARTVRRRWLPRHPLVVAQIALSLALLIAAGLFLRMAGKAVTGDNGFRADHTIVAEVDSGLGGYNESQSLDLYRAVNERLAALPGVKHASIGSLVPYGMINISREVRRAGVTPAAGDKPATAAEGLSFSARWNAVGPEYFAAMGLRQLRGRAFTAAESGHKGAPEVVVVDEALARKLWPDGDALGQRIQWVERNPARARPERTADKPGAPATAAANEPKTAEIVGIVTATKSDFFEKEFRGAIYVPFAQGFSSNAHFHVRPAVENSAAAIALVEPIRRTLREAAPGLPVFNVRPFKVHLTESTEFWMLRIGSTLFVVFALLAMVVAVVGIYGVKSYSVSRRTREIGIRMALGAIPGQVHGMILREGISMTLSGVGLGLLLGLGVGRLLSTILVDADAFDPLAFGVSALAFAAAAAIACWLPARRATKVNPMIALRAE